MNTDCVPDENLCLIWFLQKVGQHIRNIRLWIILCGIENLSQDNKIQTSSNDNTGI